MERSSSAGLTDCFAPEKSRRSSGTELKVHVALHYRPGRRRYLVVRTPAETCAYQHQESLVMFQSRFCRIVALGLVCADRYQPASWDIALELTCCAR